MGQNSNKDQEIQKTGEDSNQEKNSSETKNKPLWFKDKPKPILAEIFKQDVYF